MTANAMAMYPGRQGANASLRYGAAGRMLTMGGALAP